MNIKEEYFKSKFEEISVLSDTQKCQTVLVKNIDTNELLVKKVMDSQSFYIYNQLKMIRHKNVVKIIECFLCDNKCIEYEEYIAGKRLSDVMKEGRSELCDILKYSISLCEALEVVHEKNIIHRDVQPKNIIVSNDGVIKLIDFDISRTYKEEAQKDTSFMGTVGYAPPEQFGFAQTDERSDIYSVGVILCEMLTQYEENKKDRIIGNVTDKAVISEESKKINIKMMKKISEQCMEIDSKNRFATAKELKKMLKGCYYDNSEEYEEQLPKVTFSYIISTIPGFRSKNPINVIFAICIYGFILCLLGSMTFTMDIALRRKICGMILYEATFVVPFCYIANVGDIVQRVNGKDVYRRLKLSSRIGIGLSLMLLIVVIIGITLPIKAVK